MQRERQLSRFVTKIFQALMATQNEALRCPLGQIAVIAVLDTNLPVTVSPISLAE